MKRRVTILAALLTAGAAMTALPAPAAGAEDGKTKPVAWVVIFDFATDGGSRDLGKALAESLRLRLRRHEEYSVIDSITTRDHSRPVPASADPDKVRELMTERIGANLGVYGTVSPRGSGATAEVRCIDLTDPNKPVEWRKTISDGTERARGVIARTVVEEIRGEPEWTPPEYGDTPVPENLGEPLNRNGGFERGHTGWDHPDNCASFLVKGPPGRGTVLKIRTDLPNAPWVEYHRKLRLGLASPDNPPKLPRDTSFGSVAGLEGVHYNSEYIDVTKPNRRYWLTADALLPAPKIFVKGYLDWTDRADGLPEVSLVQMKLTPAEFARLPKERQTELIRADAKRHPERYRRETYRWYLNVQRENARSIEKGWMHLAEPFPPRGGLPEDVKWLQIQVYPYWPPATYYFDNVHLYLDPADEALEEEAARTEDFKRTSDIVEKEMEEKEAKEREKEAGEQGSKR